jgi:CubicO group peptidase (beta-lactamase class C family)
MKYIFVVFCLFIVQKSAAQVEKRLDSLLKSSIGLNEPGIALYIENNGRVIYNKGFGIVEDESLKQPKPNTNFRLASVSKQFTAMCILLLEQDKKLSIDDPISRYFPELPQSVSDKISIRQLITHSSGIIDYEEVMDNSILKPLLDIDVLNILSKQEKTYFKPGTEFRYSNSAYALLALIVERVSGQSFPEFMKDRIFEPLKMKNSMVYEANAKIPNRSFGFARDKNENIYPNDQSLTSAIQGDGGVYTSLNEYNKWTHALWNNTLIDLFTVLKRLNSPIKELTNSYYGPGWFYFENANPALFHSGSTCGFSTYSINIPSQKISIVYFSNIAGNSEPFKKILELLKSEGIENPADVFTLHQLTR